MSVDLEPEAPRSRKRRVVVVEFDVTRMTEVQIDALLRGALAISRDVSLKIEARP